MSFITIICGSPREEGRSQAFANSLFESKIKEHPECEIALVSIADMNIKGCVGCDVCRDEGECVIEDDMVDLIEYFKKTDELFIVTPIYMASVPSQLKAVLDRLQPMFWDNVRHRALRSATVHLFGEDKNPYGSEGAVLALKSALKVAGFEVKDVETHIN